MSTAVRIEAISHSYGSVVALCNVQLTIDAGRYAVLLGPSGCGKTTLLSVIGGFLQPDQGRIVIGEQDVTALPASRRPTTTMFQDYALFPHMNLLDNVGFGLRMRGYSRSQRNAKATELLALVGLPDDSARRPHELSGGQRQRVALARALAVEPEVLLLDEPLGALDLKLRRHMQDELKAIQRRVGTTFVHVTHDQEEAMAIADQVIVMRDGVIQHYGSPEEVYSRPANHFTAAFMGDANFVAGEVVATGSDYQTIRTPFGVHDFPASSMSGTAVQTGTGVEIVFRPEHIRIDDEWQSMCDFGSTTVLDKAFFGTHQRIRLRSNAAPDQIITAHLPVRLACGVGSDLRIAVDSKDVVIFPLSKTDKAT